MKRLFKSLTATVLALAMVCTTFAASFSVCAIKNSKEEIPPYEIIFDKGGKILLQLAVPRITIAFALSSFIELIPNSADYFTGFDLKNESFVETNVGDYTFSIPQGLEKNNESSFLNYYSNSEKSNYLIIMEPSDLSGLNLYSKENLDENNSLGIDIAIDNLRDGFERLGKGHPDSAYGSYKCIALLSSEDCTLWNMNEMMAFAIMGCMKAILEPSIGCDAFLVYEREDVCGILGYEIKLNETTNKNQCYFNFEFFSTDDLNTAYTLVGTVDKLGDVFAIVNSIEFNK